MRAHLRTLGIVALALVVVLVARGHSDHPPAAVSPTPAAGAGSSGAVSPRTGGDVAVPDRPGPGDERLRALGARFAREFARTTPGWADRVGRLCLPGLAERLRTVDVTDIPRTGRVRDVTVIDGASPTGRVRITYSSGLVLDLTAVWEPGGWRVLRYDRVTMPSSGGA